MKELIKIFVFVILVSSITFYVGYLTARTEIITKILEDKKDYYTFDDLSKIIIDEPK